MVTSTLKVLREVNNYTQQFVAEDILGISQNTYSRLERDPKKVTAEQAQKLSKFYNVSIENLLSENSPVLNFMENNIRTTLNGQIQNNTIHNQIEIQRLKEEVEYLRKQNSELLRIVGESIISLK